MKKKLAEEKSVKFVAYLSREQFTDSPNYGVSVKRAMVTKCGYFSLRTGNDIATFCSELFEKIVGVEIAKGRGQKVEITIKPVGRPFKLRTRNE